MQAASFVGLTLSVLGSSTADVADLALPKGRLCWRPLHLTCINACPGELALTAPARWTRRHEEVTAQGQELQADEDDAAAPADLQWIQVEREDLLECRFRHGVDGGGSDERMADVVGHDEA